MLLDSFTFGPNVQVTDDFLYASYDYASTDVVERPLHELTKAQLAALSYSRDAKESSSAFVLESRTDSYQFKTDRRVPKLGVMLVGWGGNNGTTVTAGVLANKHDISWQTKKGERKPDYFGSVTQASTVRVGNYGGKECYVPFSKLLPMVHPNDIVLGGWDVSGLDLEAGMRRAEVLDVDLQRRLGPMMREMKPLPGIFDLNFVAENQLERADNILRDMSKLQQVEKIRRDLREFKKANGVDKIVVLWTANTERFAELGKHNRSAENLMEAIEADHPEVSPSTLYAVACIMEKVLLGLVVKCD